MDKVEIPPGSPLSPNHGAILAHLLKNHPEDFEYLKAQVEGREKKGAKSKPISLPESWTEERKDRVAKSMISMGFEPQKTRKYHFLGPAKGNFLTPIKRTLDIIDRTKSRDSNSNHGCYILENKTDKTSDVTNNNNIENNINHNGNSSNQNSNNNLFERNDTMDELANQLSKLQTNSSTNKNKLISGNSQEISIQNYKGKRVAKARAFEIGCWELESDHKTIDLEIYMDFDLKNFSLVVRQLSLGKSTWILMDHQDMSEISKKSGGRLKITILKENTMIISTDSKSHDPSLIRSQDLRNVSANFSSNLIPFGELPFGELNSNDKYAVFTVHYATADICNTHYQFLRCTTGIVTPFFEKYTILKAIGEGSYAKVRLCFDHIENKEFAIKIIDTTKLTNEQIERVKREFVVTDSLGGHPNIIKMKEIYENATNIYIVMEYIPNGDLFSLIEKRKLSENEVKIIMHQMFDALNYIHLNGKIHRDLKPENILIKDIDKLEVKLIDFGEAKELTFQEELSGGDGLKGATTLVGSWKYISPEIIKVFKGQMQRYNYKTDMWSSGVIMFNLLSQREPFTDSKMVDGKTVGLPGQILNGYYSFSPKEIWDPISKEAKDLLSKLLELDPNKRISASDALSHPWFNTKR